MVLMDKADLSTFCKGISVPKRPGSPAASTTSGMHQSFVSYLPACASLICILVVSQTLSSYIRGGASVFCGKIIREIITYIQKNFYTEVTVRV